MLWREKGVEVNNKVLRGAQVYVKSIQMQEV
jgi:hypothetical protein